MFKCIFTINLNEKLLEKFKIDLFLAITLTYYLLGPFSIFIIKRFDT